MSESYKEQVFDYFVEEMLNGPKPPDLSARIEAAWMAEKEASAAEANGKRPAPSSSLDSDPSTVKNANASSSVSRRPTQIVAEVVEDALAAPVPDNTVAQTSVDGSASASTVQSSSIQSRGRGATGEGQPMRTSRMTIALTLAASALIVMLGMQAYLGTDLPELAVGDSPQENEQAGAKNSAPESPHAVSEPELLAEQDASQGPQVLEDLPFESATNPELQPEHIVETGRSAVDLERMPDRAVVGQINQRLAAMWQDLGIKPTPAVSTEERAEKIYLKLTGNPMGSLAELATKTQWRPDNDQGFDALGFSQAVAGEGRYAEHWAQLVTQQWLRRASLPMDGNQTEALEATLVKRIASDQPWNGVVADVLGGQVDQQLKQSNSVFLAALAGGGNHRLVNRIGTNFLNTNLACARCHDAGNSGGSGVVGDLREQSTYWSLLALFKGVEAKGRRGERTLTDQQSKLVGTQDALNIFYDRPDGVLQVAEPGLPDGTDWSRIADTPRQALATWIAQSPLMDDAVVNQTWKLVFGRHLVPQVPGIDVVADQQRRELLAELSDQYRAHGRSLNRLVTWMVSADAFALKPALASGEQWMQASEEDLDRHRLAELAFAAGGTLGQGQYASSLESSLAVVLDWSSTQRSPDRREISLAQPDLDAAAKDKRPATGPTKVPEAPPLSYAIHGERFTEAEIEFVDKLLSSPRLSWEDRVAHVVALNEYEAASPILQKQAKEVLLNKQGDAKAALLSLLWAVRHSQ